VLRKWKANFTCKTIGGIHFASKIFAKQYANYAAFPLTVEVI